MLLTHCPPVYYRKDEAVLFPTMSSTPLLAHKDQGPQSRSQAPGPHSKAMGLKRSPLPSHAARASLTRGHPTCAQGWGNALPYKAAHFNSRMTSQSQQGKTPGSSDHDLHSAAFRLTAVSLQQPGHSWQGSLRQALARWATRNACQSAPSKAAASSHTSAAWNNSLPPLGGDAGLLSRAKQFPPSAQEAIS